MAELAPVDDAVAAESTLIGLALFGHVLPDELPSLPRETWVHAVLAEAWLAIVRLHRDGHRIIAPHQVAAAIDREGLDEAGRAMVRQMVEACQKTAPIVGQVNLALALDDLARTVRGLAAKRQLKAVAGDIARLAEDPTLTAADALAKVERDLSALRIGESLAPTTLRELVVRLAEEVERPREVMPTGIGRLDEALAGGLWTGKLYGFAARMKVGKAQPHFEPVLMRDGTWRPIGSLRIGDELASIDGAPNRVVGVYPQGVRECMRVTLCDGRAVVADREHLWRVQTYNTTNGAVAEPETVTTERLAKMAAASRPVWLPRVSGHFGTIEDFPVAPYVLGALLGDGALSQKTVMISNPDAPVMDRVAASLPPGMIAKFASGCDYRLVVGENTAAYPSFRQQENPLKAGLEALGLMGYKAESKFIPEEYFSGTRAARQGLLQGLLDTDGSASKGGAELTTVSMELAHDVRRLAHSLGHIATMAERRRPSFTYKGEKKIGQPAYRVRIRADNPAELFSLPRKREAVLAKRSNAARLSVASVEPAGETHCVCIAVSHPTSLYVANQYTVTHNTLLGITIARNIARSGRKVLYVALEMGQAEVAQRVIADWLGTNAVAFLRRDDEFLSSRLVGYAVRKDAPELDNLLFRDAPGLTFDQLRGIAQAAVTQHGIKLMVVDYWQLVQGCPKGQSETQHLSTVAQWMADFARRAGIAIVTPAQINRNGETRGSDGLRLACDWYGHMHPAEQAGPRDRWIEALDSRYTLLADVGGANEPALFVDTVGPVMREWQR